MLLQLLFQMLKTKKAQGESLTKILLIVSVSLLVLFVGYLLIRKFGGHMNSQSDFISKKITQSATSRGTS